MELGDESSVITTFSTSFGRYRWKRYPFGIKSGQGEFQRKMEEVFEGLDIGLIIDDIAGITKDEEDHDAKLRIFVQSGVFKAELNTFLMKELAEDGYSGVEVRQAPARIEIIILATRTQSVLGEKGRRIRELTSVVQKRFGFQEGAIELYAEKVAARGLCAIAQAESLRYKLIGGLAVRRACYGVLRFIMESGAKGCEVVVSGKLRGQRAKSMKFVDGLMIHSGEPVNQYVDIAVRHVLLRQ
ncbi:hypothetical protein QYM36_009416, partial [Artemia franciscana]